MYRRPIITNAEGNNTVAENALLYNCKTTLSEPLCKTLFCIYTLAKRGIARFQIIASLSPDCAYVYTSHTRARCYLYQRALYIRKSEIFQSPRRKIDFSISFSKYTAEKVRNERRQDRCQRLYINPFRTHARRLLRSAQKTCFSILKQRGLFVPLALLYFHLRV